jgi:hypothetical protein
MPDHDQWKYCYEFKAGMS